MSRRHALNRKDAPIPVVPFKADRVPTAAMWRVMERLENGWAIRTTMPPLRDRGIYLVLLEDDLNEYERLQSTTFWGLVDRRLLTRHSREWAVWEWSLSGRGESALRWRRQQTFPGTKEEDCSRKEV